MQSRRTDPPGALAATCREAPKSGGGPPGLARAEAEHDREIVRRRPTAQREARQIITRPTSALAADQTAEMTCAVVRLALRRD